MTGGQWFNALKVLPGHILPAMIFLLTQQPMLLSNVKVVSLNPTSSCLDLAELQSQLAKYVELFNSQFLAIRDDIAHLKGSVNNSLSQKINVLVVKNWDAWN